MNFSQNLSILTLFLFFISVQVIAQLPTDNNGWTIITPPEDAKVIYVSSSEGNDSYDGLSPENPVASISKAKSLARPGYPDHILFKTGDEWIVQTGIGSFHSGRSAEEPTVLSYYGDGNTRPLFKIENNFLYVSNKELSHIAFIGLEFYAYKHDPNSPDYETETGVDAISYIKAKGENLLIEDCKFNYCQMGAYTSMEPGALKNFKFRRNIIVQSWKGDSYYVHELRTRAQGMYISGVEGITIEENLFDHNGWNEQIEGAGPNMYNHNIYMSANNPNADAIFIKGNIIARGAAHGLQLRSGGTVEDNLFIQNAVNLNIGYQESPSPAGAYGIARNNVFLECRKMDSLNSEYPRTAAVWGIASIHLPSVIENNIFAHALNPAKIVIDDYDRKWELGGELIKNDNIDYKWTTKTQEPQSDWFDPERQIKHYHQSLGKEPTTQAFLHEARKRPLKTLWPEYSAYDVNDYIRTGFSDINDETPPQAPENLELLYKTDVVISIEWSYAPDNFRTVGYNIYVEGVLNNTELIKEMNYTIMGLTAETTYNIEVKAVDAGNNESEQAAQVTVNTAQADLEPPLIPDNLQIVDKTAFTIDISWNKSTDNINPVFYNLYIDNQKDNLQSVTDTFYQFTDLEEFSVYQIQVESVDAAGNVSGKSDILTIQTLDQTKPTTPENIEVIEITNTSISLDWDPASDNGILSGYNVYVSGNKDNAEPVNPPYIINDLPPGKTQTLQVSAIDAQGNESRASKPISVTTHLTALVNASSNNIRIYYNSNNQTFCICSDPEIQQVKIINMIGKEIKQVQNINSKSFNINIREINNGLYIIQIKDIKNQMKSFKIIKF